jgi:hypothetical protein
MTLAEADAALKDVRETQTGSSHGSDRSGGTGRPELLGVEPDLSDPKSTAKAKIVLECPAD